MGIASVMFHARIKFSPAIMRNFLLHLQVNGNSVAVSALGSGASRDGFDTIEATIPGDLIAGTARYRIDFKTCPRSAPSEDVPASDAERPGFGLCLARAYCLPSAAA
jgi:hypothetical protein